MEQMRRWVRKVYCTIIQSRELSEWKRTMNQQNTNAIYYQNNHTRDENRSVNKHCLLSTYLKHGNIFQRDSHWWLSSSLRFSRVVYMVVCLLPLVSRCIHVKYFPPPPAYKQSNVMQKQPVSLSLPILPSTQSTSQTNNNNNNNNNNKERRHIIEV